MSRAEAAATVLVEGEGGPSVKEDEVAVVLVVVGLPERESLTRR